MRGCRTMKIGRPKLRRPEFSRKLEIDEAVTNYLLNCQRPKSSRRRLVCARLTGISVCFLSSMRS